MEQCVNLGFMKAIGVSKFSCKNIGDLLSHAKIPLAVSQVSYSCFDHRACNVFWYVIFDFVCFSNWGFMETLL